MPNPEHVAIFRQGVRVWNQWRASHPEVQPDLSQLNIRIVDLSSEHFVIDDSSQPPGRTDRYRGVELSGVNFSDTDLRFAELSYPNLSGANFGSANLFAANLGGANLRGANLSDAILIYTNLANTSVSDANFHKATTAFTIFTSIPDLHEAECLSEVWHSGPSPVGIDTLSFSKGEIPEIFLRGAGVPDSFIAFARSLVVKVVELNSCFISYSSRDQEFANRLYADLQANGVRCWFAPEDLKIGDRFRDRIDESIRLHDKLLLVLSENSIQSAWVRTEVEAAFERENRENRSVLFPIRLDDTVMHAGGSWAADIRRTRHIGDFSRWKDHDAYQAAFQRLLRDLAATPSDARK